MKFKKNASTFIPIENTTKPRENIEYIASLLSQLKKMSDESEDKMLTYLIEIAEIHALDIMMERQKSQDQYSEQNFTQTKEG